jgi:sulfur relay (sulfurtransferase) complex TusBCD TusD component (DsrE family)
MPNLALVISRAADWPTVVGLARAARRAGVEVAIFAMDEAVAAVAADPAGRDALLDDDCDLVACGTSASARGLGEVAMGVLLGSQDDHAAMVHRADRVVAFT